MAFCEIIKSGDWKNEKHSPSIELLSDVKLGKPLNIKVSVGKEIKHPNTTTHHIAWFDLYFVPDGNKNPYHIGKYSFGAHGESPKGADEGPVYSEPEVTLTIVPKEKGSIKALSFCNIHGIWENEIKLEI